MAWTCRVSWISRFSWLQPGKVLIVEGVLEELSLGQMVGRQGEQSPCCLANRDTHTDAFTYGTPTQETLEQRFVIVFHFDGGVLLLLEISLVSLLLSSSESVRLRVQQTPLMMVTGRSSFSNCPQAICEEFLSNQPLKFFFSFFFFSTAFMMQGQKKQTHILHSTTQRYVLFLVID